jgi:hypothetical protein
MPKLMAIENYINQIQNLYKKSSTKLSKIVQNFSVEQLATTY